MLRVTVIICGILLGLLLAAIVVASRDVPVLVGLQRVLTDPWGMVTLLDLGVGLLFVATWIAVIEPRPLFAAAWIISLFLLGNATTLVFLLWRTRYAQSFAELFLPSRRSDWIN
jgi:hypothetical protein